MVNSRSVGIEGSLWARSELLVRLEQHPDVLETFFYSVFAELASHFRSEHLELFKLTLDPAVRMESSRMLKCSASRDVAT